jgi:hypothetical protein
LSADASDARAKNAMRASAGAGRRPRVHQTAVLDPRAAPAWLSVDLGRQPASNYRAQALAIG